MLSHFSIAEILVLKSAVSSNSRCRTAFDSCLGLGGKRLRGRLYGELERVLEKVMEWRPLASWVDVGADFQLERINLVAFMVFHALECTPGWSNEEDDQEPEMISVLRLIEVQFLLHPEGMCMLSPGDSFVQFIVRVCAPASGRFRYLVEDRLIAILKCSKRCLREVQQQWLLVNLYHCFRHELYDPKRCIKVFKEVFDPIILANTTCFFAWGLTPLSKEEMEKYYRLSCEQLEIFAGRLPSITEEGRRHIVGECRGLTRYLLRGSPAEKLNKVMYVYRESREHALPWRIMNKIHLAIGQLPKSILDEAFSQEEILEHERFGLLRGYLFGHNPLRDNDTK